MKDALLRMEKTPNASAYLPLLGADADGEFRAYAAENDEDMYALLCGESPVGLAQAAADDTAWLYVYIFPQYRGRGFGRQAALLLEDILKGRGSAKIQSCFRHDDAGCRRFAEGLGYGAEFASAFMVYGGAPLYESSAQIRPYRSEDFDAAHRLCAEAFHLMRLNTGYFPDSTVEEADDETRQYWSSTAGRRFVYAEGEEILGLLALDGTGIDCVAVKPGHWRQGIGGALVSFGVKRLLSEGREEISLYCVSGNPARSLYEGLGFRPRYLNQYVLKAL